MNTDELVFLPLGGSNEVGMNFNLYGYGPPENRRWLVVDVGVTFGGIEHPGVEVIVPDPAYIEQYKDDIEAIVLTHAHEDHIGAIGWLWPMLRAPVYATPLTAELARYKLEERGLGKSVKINEIPLRHRFTAGPFELELVTITHSIPEMNGLVIRTPLGAIFHTGDWKLDSAPMIGDVTDEARIRAIGDEGVLAMVCDSTNVFVEGEAGSESQVRKALADVVARCRGRVAVTAFASNVARVESAVLAAEKAGRSVCLVGRSMHKIAGAAKKIGLLSDVRPFISEEEAAGMAASSVLYLCTGSQGEARAALARIAAGDHRHVALREGDTVIFSSRVIPGNEAAIHDLQAALVDRGVEIITDKSAPEIHVSGHPCRDELRRMYQWVRPRIAVPTHGERRHILEHAAFARALQTPEAATPRNGEMVLLAPGPSKIVDEVPAGRLFVDGDFLVPADDDAIKDRRRLGAEGALTVSMAVSGKKHTIVSGPDVRVRGLTMADEEDLEIALDDLSAIAEAAFNKLSAAERRDPDLAEDAVMRAVRKGADRIWGKRPLVDVVILTV
jgi:ribonuclease J